MKKAFISVVLLAVLVAGISQAYEGWGSGSRYTDYGLHDQPGYVYFSCTLAAMKWGNDRVDGIIESRDGALENADLNMSALDDFVEPPLPSPKPALPDNAPAPAKLILRRVNGWITAVDVGIWIGVAAVNLHNKYKDYRRNVILGDIHNDYQVAIDETDDVMRLRTTRCAANQNAVDRALDAGLIGNQSDFTVNYAIVQGNFHWQYVPRRTKTYADGPL